MHDYVFRKVDLISNLNKGKQMSEKIMLRRKHLMKFLGISAPTLWRWINQGDFPAGKKLSERTRIWDQDEVLQWIENRDQRQSA